MNGFGVFKNALFALALLGFSAPQAEAIEIFSGANPAAHMNDDMITQVRGVAAAVAAAACVTTAAAIAAGACIEAGACIVPQAGRAGCTAGRAECTAECTGRPLVPPLAPAT